MHNNVSLFIENISAPTISLDWSVAHGVLFFLVVVCAGGLDMLQTALQFLYICVHVEPVY